MERTLARLQAACVAVVFAPHLFAAKAFLSLEFHFFIVFTYHSWSAALHMTAPGRNISRFIQAYVQIDPTSYSSKEELHPEKLGAYAHFSVNFFTNC